jgi:hypothetical protein
MPQDEITMKCAIFQNEIVKPGKGQAARAPAHCQHATHYRGHSFFLRQCVMAKGEETSRWRRR